MKVTFPSAPVTSINSAMLFGVLILMTGCGGAPSFHPSPTPTPAIPVLKGKLLGGQVGISGSSVQFYAAGSTGYGSGALALLSPAVITDQDGDFQISTGSYTCPSGNPETYLVSTGGDPGTGANNPAIAEMAALGPCGGIGSIPFVVIDEVTTIASVWPLAPFMNYGAEVGTSPANGQGLTTAFANVNSLADITQGSSPGTSVPTGVTIPVEEINTLANILASCVNSTGTTACDALFAAATPPDGTAPTNTLDAALDIALNPGANVAALFALPTPDAPFGPSLSSPPSDWTFGNAITTNPAPVISNLSPASLPVGSASQTLTINGAGFLASSTVTFNGIGHAATYINANQLSISLASTDLSIPSIFPVVVANPVPGGGVSTAVGFSVTAILAEYCTVINQTVTSGQTSIEYQCENFIYWINQTTGQLTWVNETGPDDFGACTATYAVDSVNGSDSNPGTCAAPFQTLGKLNSLSLANGNSIAFAANSHWQTEGFEPSGAVTNLTLSAYGTGNRPWIDGSVSIANANFTLNSGDTITYTATAPIDNFTTGTLGFYENGTRLPYYNSVANVEANAGSYYYDPTVCKTGTATSCVFYVHPVGSTNPITDGNAYTYTRYGKGVYNNGGENWTVSGLEIGPQEDAALFLSLVTGSYVHDVLLMGGSTHSIYTAENDKLVNLVIDSPYDDSFNGGDGPNPIINYFTPAGGTMEYDSIVVVMPQTPVANNGSCVAAYGHTPSGTDPTPSLTYSINYAKLINCTNGWEDTDVVASTYNGLFSGGNTQAAISSSATSSLTVNGLIQTSLYNGANQTVSLKTAGMNATLNNLHVTCAASVGDSYLVNAAHPFGTLTLTNSSMTGAVEGIHSDSSTASSSVVSNHNTFSGVARAYDLTTAPTTIASNYNIFPFGQYGHGGIHSGSTYADLAAWQATGQDLNSGPTLLLSAGWGTTAYFGSSFTSNWPSDTGGQFVFIADGSGLAANATVTYTFAVPYTTPPVVTPTYTGTGSTTWTQSVTTSAITWTQTATPLARQFYYISYTVAP